MLSRLAGKSPGSGSSRLSSQFLERLRGKDEEKKREEEKKDIKAGTKERFTAAQARTDMHKRKAADARALVLALGAAEQWTLQAFQAHVQASLLRAAAKEEEEERKKHEASWRSLLKPSSLGAKPSMSRQQLEELDKTFALFTPAEMAADKHGARFRATVLNRVVNKERRSVLTDLLNQMEANARIHKFVRARVVSGLPVPDKLPHLERAIVNVSRVGQPRQAGVAWREQRARSTLDRWRLPNGNQVARAAPPASGKTIQAEKQPAAAAT